MRTVGKRARVDNAFVGNAPCWPLVKNVERTLQPLGDVVGIQNRNTGRLSQAVPTHHQAIGPRNRQQRGRSERGSRNRPVAGCWIAGQMGNQVFFHANWPHARPTATMRDTERLMQIKVADVAAKIAGARQPDHRVHICAVNIDLPTVVVGDLAHIGHSFFKNPVGRWIGDHTCRKVIGVLFRHGPKVVQINVTIRGRLNWHNLPSNHMGRRRIGTVRRHRDQTNIAMTLIVCTVITCDAQQPRIFPLRARIGLHGNRVIACDITQLCRQIIDHFHVPRRLVAWDVGVQQREFVPRHRHHFRRRV